MKLPRVRFTMRRMMVAVAIVALAIGIERLYQRRAAYKRLASLHSSRQERAIKLAASQSLSVELNREKGNVQASSTWDRMLSRSRLEIQQQSLLASKYEYLANHPWLSVTPEDPKPK
jgi:hypothetical protein